MSTQGTPKHLEGAVRNGFVKGMESSTTPYTATITLSVRDWLNQVIGSAMQMTDRLSADEVLAYLNAKIQGDDEIATKLHQEYFKRAGEKKDEDV